MLTAINNAIVIIKNASKIQTFCILQVVFFSLKFVGIVFVSLLHDSVISSHLIAESSIIVAKYFPFLQLDVVVFQYNLFQIHDVFFTHINICRYSTINLSYIFFHQIYIYIRIRYALLIFLIHLLL